MNSMERVVAALQHQEPDRVPVYPILCGITRKLTGVSHINVHHHAVAGAVVHLLDLGIVIKILDHALAVVGMRCLVLVKDQLLTPCGTFNGQVDQGHDTVDIKLLR